MFTSPCSYIVHVTTVQATLPVRLHQSGHPWTPPSGTNEVGIVFLRGSNIQGMPWWPAMHAVRVLHHDIAPHTQKSPEKHSSSQDMQRSIKYTTRSTKNQVPAMHPMAVQHSSSASTTPPSSSLLGTCQHCRLGTCNCQIVDCQTMRDRDCQMHCQDHLIGCKSQKLAKCQTRSLQTRTLHARSAQSDTKCKICTGGMHRYDEPCLPLR